LPVVQQIPSPHRVHAFPAIPTVPPAPEILSISVQVVHPLDPSSSMVVVSLPVPDHNTSTRYRLHVKPVIRAVRAALAQDLAIVSHAPVPVKFFVEEVARSRIVNKPMLSCPVWASACPNSSPQTIHYLRSQALMTQLPSQHVVHLNGGRSCSWRWAARSSSSLFYGSSVAVLRNNVRNGLLCSPLPKVSMEVKDTGVGRLSPSGKNSSVIFLAPATIRISRARSSCFQVP